MRFLTGGYTADMDGAGSGIGMLFAGAPDDALAGGPLGFAGTVATADSPSWVARHPSLDVVYASLEGTGAVQGFRRTGEQSFVALGEPVPTGRLNCHVVVSPDASYLVAACWGDGRVVRVGLDAAGRPGAASIAPAAVDPYGPDAPPRDADGTDGGIDLAAAARALREVAGEYAYLIPGGDGEEEAAQALTHAEAEPQDADARVSRAHEAMFLPGGLVVTTDLGYDLVRFWRATPEGLRPVQQVVLPKGSGPRHMVRHPSGHVYVITELSHEVFVLGASREGVWSVVGGTSIAPGVLPTDTGAELALSHDAAFLYAGVRGTNTIGTLRVRGSGESLEPVALVEAGVDWPRHHLVVRDTLLVAGQKSDDVASLTLDTRTGVPGKVRHRTAVPSPTCLVALP
ncbi:lactonase family protein [Microbacterium rhizosphaerae]|uniref:Beta-propeller fold lactonase family protein n=1 Tax=Microbacterium rhizosphaerae TaxID=1678237 RepID=A0ABZ0SMQ0_9MICO|nr:beta-propeller fold lactonase family protein [Microbacterium rhizosphaerae]WPR89908.1 beta-propeller fold lactonase family protein [Microbacterium rhizosphaerae]